MKVSKAVEILLLQKEKLGTENLRQDTWLTQTSSFVKDFFGDTSNEYKFIKEFRFYSKNLDSLSAEYDTNYYIKTNTKAASDFVDNCIDTLKYKGLYKAPRQNFITQLSETAIWTVIGVGVTGLLSAGFFFGNLSSDRQNIELRQENKSLKDTLRILRFSAKPTGNIPGNRADKIHESPKTDK